MIKPSSQTATIATRSSTRPVLPTGRPLARLTTKTTPLPRSRISSDRHSNSSYATVMSPQKPRIAVRPLERHPRCAPFEDGVGGEEAHHCVKVKATSSLIQTAHKLHQVGGRGLLSHDQASIPPGRRGADFAATASIATGRQRPIGARNLSD